MASSADTASTTSSHVVRQSPQEGTATRQRRDEHSKTASPPFGPAVNRTNNNERLRTPRVMFGTMACKENPGAGRPGKRWLHCLLGDDVNVFRATEESKPSTPLLFQVQRRCCGERRLRRGASSTGESMRQRRIIS